LENLLKINRFESDYKTFAVLSVIVLLTFGFEY